MSATRLPGKPLLKINGLDSMTISLDSLSKESADAINPTHNDLTKVLRSIDDVIKVYGFIKVNMVIIKDKNSDEVIKMVKNQAINCFSGKQIPCEIDSICVHGDGKSAVSTAKKIKDGLLENGVNLKTLNKLK